MRIAKALAHAGADPIGTAADLAARLNQSVAVLVLKFLAAAAAGRRVNSIECVVSHSLTLKRHRLGDASFGPTEEEANPSNLLGSAGVQFLYHVCQLLDDIKEIIQGEVTFFGHVISD